jgi:hypothetical protein
MTCPVPDSTVLARACVSAQIIFSIESSVLLALLTSSGLTISAVAFGTVAATFGRAEIADPAEITPQVQDATNAAATSIQATR